VEGPVCKFIETQGLLKESGLIQPWIFDPTAVAAVDRVVNPVHGSTVDRTEGVRPALIRSVRVRSSGPGLERAGRGGGHAGIESDAAACGGAPPAQPREEVPGGQNEHERVLP
jgi:hypothetical protein